MKKLPKLTKQQHEWLHASLQREKRKISSLSINHVEEYIAYLLNKVEPQVLRSKI